MSYTSMGTPARDEHVEATWEKKDKDLVYEGRCSLCGEGLGLIDMFDAGLRDEMRERSRAHKAVCSYVIGRVLVF